MKPLIAATRGSALALWQTRLVASLLHEAGCGTTTLSVITTRGDTDLSERLQGKLEKGFFTAELEDALRSGAADFAVHSLKDLPTQDPAGLTIGAVLQRAPASDLLICRPEQTQARGALELPLRRGAVLGASSLRRAALTARFGAGLASCAPLRGNVPTRVEKLARGDYAAIVLARAGVERLQLDLTPFVVFELNPRLWQPAPGQGAVAVQCRVDDASLRAQLATLSHRPTEDAVTLERGYLRVLEGGCTTPFGAWSDGAQLWLGMDTPSGWRSTSLDAAAAAVEAGAASRVLDALRLGQTEEATDDAICKRL